MLVRELYKTRPDGVKLYRTYSDEDFMVLQNETGVEFEEAIDLENVNFTYTETNHKIHVEEIEEEEEKENEEL